MALKSRNIVLTSFGLLVAGALGYTAFRTDPVPVDLHTITRGPMQVTINADGKTRIREVYEVAAPISGTALRSPVRVGDPVIADETVVAVLEPASSNLLDARTRIQAEAAVREAEAALHQARSRMREARDDLTLADREYERARVLVDRGVASVTRLENAEQQLGTKRAAQDAAISGLEMAKSALDRARAALFEPVNADSDDYEACCLQLTAPTDGRVLEIDMISERPVTAGTRLLSVGQADDLEIVADLLSVDAVKLELGDRASVERWGRATPLDARISKIEPSAYTKVSALGIEEQRVDVVFDFLTPAQDRQELGDYFSVFLRIVEWEADDVLMVPVSAIFRIGNEWAVFRVDANQAHLQPVTIGRRNASVAQVLTGLEEGDRVITHPSDDTEDGVTIAERNQP
ncbi:HlyD family efflux transporter periplasmic adaptor subunit [uncultured Roseovarius sp.]|uniref:efflux RND transporter periplasmic adaptor subunit n=1 Tax=uncultured Roseovarius sp. TaxID=293344 RepID=UPI0026352E5A|nr:HlyD family efflux transporter periplasmic adaptor subunit [uncultured Roseovarius sp.]